MAKRKAWVMSQHWQEGKSNDLSRNKHEMNKSITRDALGLLKEIGGNRMD